MDTSFGLSTMVTCEEKKVTKVSVTPIQRLEWLHQSHWLELGRIHYRQPHSGQMLTWEVARRVPPMRTLTTSEKITTTTTETVWPGLTLDAVDVHAVMRGQGRVPHILLVLQYRPPVDAYTLEFPSGLIEAGETPEVAALRELHEETGYHGKVISVGPLIPYEPGLTNSGTRMVQVEVDLDAPENLKPQQKLDGAYEEGLEVIQLPLRALWHEIEQFTKQRPGVVIDSRLYNYALGQSYQI